MATVQLSSTFSTLQRLQREYAAVGTSLSQAEGRLAELEQSLASEVPAATEGSAAAASEKVGVTRELARLKARRAILRLSHDEDHPEMTGVNQQIQRLEAEIHGLENNPLDDPTLVVSSDVGHLLAQMEQAVQDINTLKARREDLERRIGIFQAWAFEENSEPLPTSLAPAIASVLTPDTPENEVFRMLRTKVQSLDEEKAFRCFGLVSAGEGEGKTTAALSLALSMAADQGTRVLLIEADLRQPTIERYLGLPRRVGLGDWLKGSLGPARLRRLDPQGLCLLTAGAPVSQATELLGSGRMAQLMEIARQSFDFIVVDCPPPFPLADSVILQELLDGFLFVVRARHSARETIQASLPHLRAESIRGVIFNDHREILPRFYTQGYNPYQGYKR